ncbi:hypothetical protein OIO90_005251 [Microbotryomycetes sp. JL221]|nr:hypothetical protein OIO90_005251 [Microbotryomycetes sp. JL221]
MQFVNATFPNRPKVHSRAVVSGSKDDEEQDYNLAVYYCLCGEVSQTVLEALQRRPVDGTYVLRNTGDDKHVYKLNATAPSEAAADSSTTGEAAGVLIRRGTHLEYQRPLVCPRCQLQVAYETVKGENKKGDATFLLPGAMTAQQGALPSEALTATLPSLAT